MLERFDRVVRCRDGHLFTTVWVPLASFKAVRLSGRRWQRCPVGRHWTMVAPVDEAGLDSATLAAARSIHDIRIP